jgi:hypothetical protein
MTTIKLRPGMVFEYVSVSVSTKEKNSEPELLIIIDKISDPGYENIKSLICYKVEDARLHTISPYVLLKYYNLLYTADRKEQRRGEKKLKI